MIRWGVSRACGRPVGGTARAREGFSGTAKPTGPSRLAGALRLEGLGKDTGRGGGIPVTGYRWEVGGTAVVEAPVSDGDARLKPSLCRCRLTRVACFLFPVR